jgi:photosystem II stability/assembly factor-like uncharacterized protein
MRSKCRLLLPLVLLILPLRTASGGVGEWTPFGPGGGEVYGLAVDPFQRGTVYAATRVGPFRSTDGGSSWELVGVPWYGGADAGPIAADPSRPGTVWRLVGGNVIRSDDRGDHWESVNRDLVYSSLLTVAPAPSGTLFAALGDEVKRSTDEGVSWSSQVIPFADIHSVLVDPAAPATVYLGSRGSSGGVFKSVDGGFTFDRADRRADGEDLGPVAAVALSPRDPRKLWAAQGSTVWASADGAVSWNEAGSLSFTPRILHAHPVFPNTLFAAGAGGVFLSRDGGRTWKNHDREGRLPREASGASDVLALAIEPFSPPSAVYAGTRSHGVYRRSAGNPWLPLVQTGLVANEVLRVTRDPLDPETVYLVLTSAYGSAVVSRDGGLTWSPFAWQLRSLGRFTDLFFHPNDPGALYGVIGRRLIRSGDRGESWSFVGQLPQVPGPLAFAGPRALLLGGCGVWRSPDGGRSWSAALPCRFTVGQVEAERTVSRLVIDPKTPANVYALAFERRPHRNVHRVYRSHDGGVTWKPLASETQAFAMAPSRPERLYVERWGLIRRSDDSGRTWQMLAHVGSTAAVLVVDPKDPDVVYFSGIGRGILRSLDGGVTWEQLENGLDRDVTALEIHPVSPRRLYAFTLGGGVFEREVPAAPP